MRDFAAVLVALSVLPVAVLAVEPGTGAFETVVAAPIDPPENPLVLEENPTLVEVFTRKELKATGAFTVQGALRQLMGGEINDEQGNPFQTDLTYRGLKSSSVTGLSQGLSVFVDGVRVNEADADEVNFDLIPLDDVDRIELTHGPSSLSGRNLAGVTLQIITRRGRTAPLAEAEVSAGNFNHQQYSVRSGWVKGPWDLYASGTYLTDQGFRAVGQSQQVRAFVKGGYRENGLDMTLSYQFQRDILFQPGSLPISLERTDPTANYTGGDAFAPRLHQLAFNLSDALGHGFLLVANAYGRFLDSSQFNANAEGPDTLWYNRTRSFGASLQLRHELQTGHFSNEVVIGGDYSHHQVAARLFLKQNPGSLADCLDDPGPEDCPSKQLTTILRDSQSAGGAFLFERARWRFGDGDQAQSLIASVAVRFDAVTQRIDDLSPINPGAATGRGEYYRVTPAVSVEYDTGHNVEITASYQQGFRPPAMLELSCADAGAPCVGLQAGVAPDPGFGSLRPIGSQTFEISVRAHPWKALLAQATAFRIDLHDDIYSVSPTTTSIFFQNVGSTRRQGIELFLRSELGSRVKATLRYTYLAATFQSGFMLASPRDEDGEQVGKGNLLPLVPQHVLRAAVEYRITSWASVGANCSYIGQQYLLGDEENAEAPLPGYFLLGVNGRVRWNTFYAQASISNVTNASHLTFGTFAANGSTLEPFVSPGEPLRFTVNLGGAL